MLDQGEVKRRLAVAVMVLSVFAVAVMLWVEPVPQDVAYHAFADQRPWLGIRHGLNVLSNVPFLLAGLWALYRLRRVREPLRAAYAVFAVAVTCVALGSSYYHLNPNHETLIWDRLPMTVAFMSLFALLLGDRLSERSSRLLLWPLVMVGVASVLYWGWTESLGRGDLRPYALVQYLPLLLIPVLVLVQPRGYISNRAIGGALAAYLVSKYFELSDTAVFDRLVWVSGHSLKHLLAAVAVCSIAGGASHASDDKPTIVE